MVKREVLDNVCAYLSAIDILKRSRWSEKIRVCKERTRCQNLLEILSGKNE